MSVYPSYLLLPQIPTFCPLIFSPFTLSSSYKMQAGTATSSKDSVGPVSFDEKNITLIAIKCTTLSFPIAKAQERQ